jgi:hypothetical protein
MLNHAADLSDSHEYFIVWAGDTNSRPWGAKADAYSLFPEFQHAADGLDLTADFTPGGHNAGATTTVTISVAAGTNIAENEWAGSTFRMGENTGAALGYGIIQSNDAITSPVTVGDVTVTWTIGLSGGAAGVDDPAYIVREGRKWGSYPQVRVLTPYQPVDQEDSATEATIPYPSPAATFANGGRSLTLPAPYSGTTTAAAFSDLGVMLPFTFFEGIDGWGISEQDDSAGGGGHAITGIAGTTTKTWTYNTAAGVTDHLNGGYVIVDWESGGVMKRSWAPIIDSTTTTFDVLSTAWLGDGDPGVDHTVVKRYTAWVPHYNDSPHAYLPGEGFTYPNNDMMPCSGSAIGGNVHNRPRGITGDAYGDKFGALLVAASRLSAAIGKRVNVVNLGVTDSSLVPSNARNASGFNGTLGWWSQDDHGTWAPSDSSSIYARLDKLLRTVLPNALLAEASTKTLRCLGIVFAHGETDALETSARQHYRHTQKRLIKALRNLIGTLGFNPYDNGAEIPYVQPRIAYMPHAQDGTYARDSERGGGTVAINADTLNLVNTAIEETTTADEFSTSIRVDDLPRLTTDPAIYSGTGEAELGSRVGEQLSRLVDYALGFGSTALANTQTRLVDICNLALTNVGEGQQITSLTDGSEEAILCRRYLTEVRDDLLQMQQWGFAQRRRQLVGIQKTEPGLFQNWERCYVMPADALNAFSVIGPVNEPGKEDFDYQAVTTSSYAADFISNDGSSITPAEAATSPAVQRFPGEPTGSSGVVLGTDDLLPVLSHVEINPQAYAVEQSPFGHRYIYTNQTHATLQYTARVADADQYSSPFASAMAAYLASKLAGALIKGDKGEAVSVRMLQKAAGYVRMAAASDANQQNPIDTDRPFGRIPDHMVHRGVDYDQVDGAQDNLSYYPSGLNIS